MFMKYLNFGLGRRFKVEDPKVFPSDTVLHLPHWYQNQATFRQPLGPLEMHILSLRVEGYGNMGYGYILHVDSESFDVRTFQRNDENILSSILLSVDSDIGMTQMH